MRGMIARSLSDFSRFDREDTRTTRRIVPPKVRWTNLLEQDLESRLVTNETGRSAEARSRASGLKAARVCHGRFQCVSKSNISWAAVARSARFADALRRNRPDSRRSMRHR